MCETVEIYDFETQKVSTISKKDLSPEMIIVKFKNTGKTYWVNRNQLKRSDYKHPPFEGIIKERIQKLMLELSEVSKSNTYDEWESNFRRDDNPEKELVIWEYIAKQYTKHSPKYVSLGKKQDIYYLLLTCSSSDKDSVLKVTKLYELTVPEANEIINSYYKK